MITPLIQYPYQLSEAACDLVKTLGYSCFWSNFNIPKHNSVEEFLVLVATRYPIITYDPQDMGIETFAGDTLDGGMPDD